MNADGQEPDFSCKQERMQAPPPAHPNAASSTSTAQIHEPGEVIQHSSVNRTPANTECGTSNASEDHSQRRRVFCWSREATQLICKYKERLRATPQIASVDKAQLVQKLMELSGNPRDACLRFLRRLGLVEKRSYREWTKPEQQRLIELIDRVPVEEAARILRRPAASVRSMLHRLGLGARQSREWFTLSLLAQALHISRDEVERWVSRGWLKCRAVQTNGLKIRIIDPEDFCEFVKRHGREIVGRRLTYDTLLFVRNYVLPPKHAEILSVRGTYKKGGRDCTGKEINREDSTEKADLLGPEMSDDDEDVLRETA